jgi:hypothetical protein
MTVWQNGTQIVIGAGLGPRRAAVEWAYAGCDKGAATGTSGGALCWQCTAAGQEAKPKEHTSTDNTDSGH